MKLALCKYDIIIVIVIIIIIIINIIIIIITQSVTEWHFVRKIREMGHTHNFT